MAREGLEGSGKKKKRMKMLKIVSLNVNGLRTYERGPKRRKMFTWLKKKNADIYMLQETHSEEKDANRWLNEWGGVGYFAHGDSRSRGVCILLRPGAAVEMKLVEADPNGRYLIVDVETNGVSMTLVTLYGPNADEPAFFENVHARLDDHQIGDLIVGGDFNLGLDRNLDRKTSSRNVSNNDRCKRAVEHTMNEYNLVDIWREQNPFKREYTYIRQNGRTMSRIDFFLASETLLYGEGETKTRIVDGFLADHRMIVLEMQLTGIDIGKSYWKCKSDLLKDEQFQEMVKSRVPIIIADNDTADVSRTLLLETTLCVLRGEIIKYAATKKRQREQEFKELDVEINNMIRNFDTLDQEGKDRMELKKSQMDNLISNMTDKNIWNAKLRWRMYAERGTKYFYGLPRRSSTHNVCKAMVMSNYGTKTGEITVNRDEMLHECQTYFEKLYDIEQEKQSDTNFLNGIPSLTASQRESCENRFDSNELEQALFSMKNGTSPGPCGYTAEFFKTFWPEFKVLITQAVDEILDTGHMSREMKASITILIPKRGKDRRRVENLRPISLLNVLYKLITKAIALRVRKVIKDLIHDDQTGFIHGRYIGENVRLILDTIQYCNENEISAMLLACDMQKAYDSVGWAYLKEVVRKNGFGPNFQKWIDILYVDSPDNLPTARVQLNGFLSEPYVIKRGLRQGCPLSCYLFLLCIEPLICRLRDNDSVRGVDLPGPVTVKVSAYADDLTIFLDGAEDSLRECITTFEKFEAISGLKLNKHKTHCIWIGDQSQTNDFICEDIGLRWTREPIEILGLLISSDPQLDMIQTNYLNKIDKLQQRLNPWLQRGLTPYGKILLVKSVALSQLTYVMSVLPEPRADLVKRIENIIFEFIWNKKRARVKKGVLKMEYKKGGLKVPDVLTVARSLKVGWVKRYLDQNNSSNWKKVVSPLLKITEEVSIFQCNPEVNQIQRRVNNIFWREAVLAWREVAQKETPTAGEVLNEVIWFNKNIRIERVPGIRRNVCIAKGIVKVNDLYDNNRRRMLSANELAIKFGIHPLPCQSLIRIIPESWRAILHAGERVTMVGDKAAQEMFETKKVVRWAYLKIIRKNETRPIACDKWEDELGLPATYDWDRVFNRAYIISDDRRLRWLQFQCLHRFLPTNKRLYMYGLTESNKCRNCPMYQESIAHLFWHCQDVARFWRQLKDKFGIKEVLSIQQVICGAEGASQGADRLNLLILIAKQFIWHCRIGDRPVTFQTFISRLQQYSLTERHVAQINNKVERYDALWRATNVVLNGA